MLHTRGSFHAFRVARTTQKWLRVHPYFECRSDCNATSFELSNDCVICSGYDLYRASTNDDLQKFFDHYCKGIDNDWVSSTPPVRLSVIGYEGSTARTIVERPEMEWPLQRQQMQSFYLDASTHRLTAEPPWPESSTSYDSHSLDASTVNLLLRRSSSGVRLMVRYRTSPFIFRKRRR